MLDLPGFKGGMGRGETSRSVLASLPPPPQPADICDAEDRVSLGKADGGWVGDQGLWGGDIITTHKATVFAGL